MMQIPFELQFASRQSNRCGGACKFIQIRTIATFENARNGDAQGVDAMANSGKGEREPGSVPSGGDLATLCDQQAGGGFANPPMQRIEQVVRPNTQQQNALADLKKASEDAASDLQASCPTQMPQTPVARRRSL